MAQIAEDLFLLLLDNASAQPALERDRRERLLAAAVLLDLAYACRIRPAVPGDPTQAGLLLALAAIAPGDPIPEPAFQLLQRSRLNPGAAPFKLRKTTHEQLAVHLERLGQLRRVPCKSRRFRLARAW